MEARNETKMQKLHNGFVIIAGSGSTAAIDYFGDKLSKVNEKFQGNSVAITDLVEDTLREVKLRYLPRAGKDDDFSMQAIVAGLESLESGDPYMRVVYDNGTSEKVKEYHLIGHGASHASTIFAAMYSPLLTAREVGILGHFVIAVIERLGVDQSVGTGESGAEVVIIQKDQKPVQLNTADEDFMKARQAVKALNFKSALAGSIWVSLPGLFKI